MAAKVTSGATRGTSKRSTKPAQSGASSKIKNKTVPKPPPTQHKPKPTEKKKKLPPHARYTEKELKVPQLNGIRPAGVQKPPNAKKGKTFVDDKDVAALEALLNEGSKTSRTSGRAQKKMATSLASAQCKVAGNELIVQSLILGKLYEG